MADSILDSDLRPCDTQYAISMLRKYFEVMEAQIEEVHRCERIALESERPENTDEEEHQLFCNQEDHLEETFQRELTPAMRYSFIVLMHTVFETRLRAFCSAMKEELSIPIWLAELRGSAIERARTYLTKLAKLPVGGLADWEHLRTLQKIRDCIVHTHGNVRESQDAQAIREIATENIGVTINEFGRLALAKGFCDQYLGYLDRFFHDLFDAAGWKP